MGGAEFTRLEKGEKREICWWITVSNAGVYKDRTYISFVFFYMMFKDERERMLNEMECLLYPLSSLQCIVQPLLLTSSA